MVTKAAVACVVRSLAQLASSAMSVEERPIAFDPVLLREVEARAGGDLSAFVSAAVRRELDRLGGALEAGPAPLEEFQAGYLAALLDRDPRRARSVAERAVASGIDVPDVFVEIFGPALAEIGHRWAIDEVSVAHEHLATSVTRELIATLAPSRRAEPVEGRLAVVAGTPDELHDLGALMATDLLGRAGWEVLHLGAATPAADLIDLVELECPDVVALSCTTAGRLSGVSDVLRRLRGVRPRPLVVAGGALFRGEARAVASELGADLVLTDVRELVPALRERLAAPA